MFWTVKIEEIFSKLLDPNFLNGEEDISDNNRSFENNTNDAGAEFQMSPMLLEFMRSKSLAEIGNDYHSTCVQASVYIQNDPKLFLKIVSSIIPDISIREENLFSYTPILKCPPAHKSFQVKLKKL